MMVAPRIYILCGNAAHNRGDRGNLLCQIRLLRERFPGGDITLDSYCDLRDAQWYGVRVLPRSLFLNLQQIRYLKQADIVVWGGGALLADNSCRLLVPQLFLILAFVRLILRKPIMAWAHGVVLETWLGKCFAALCLRMVDTVTVRDRNSEEALRPLCGRLPLERTADPAILLQPPARAVGEGLLDRAAIPRDKPIIAICPTFWHFYHDHHSILPYPMGKRFSRTLARHREAREGYQRGLSVLSRSLVESLGVRVLLLPRYPDAAWDDLHYCREIAAAAGPDVCVWEDDSAPPEEYFALWRCFAMVISVAMHDAIFAAAVGTPVLHLHYEAKGKDFFDAITRPDLIMPWEELLSEAGLSRVLARAEACYHDPDSASQATKEAVHRMQQRAAHNADILASLLRQGT